MSKTLLAAFAATMTSLVDCNAQTRPARTFPPLVYDTMTTKRDGKRVIAFNSFYEKRNEADPTMYFKSYHVCDDTLTELLIAAKDFNNDGVLQTREITGDMLIIDKHSVLNQGDQTMLVRYDRLHHSLMAGTPIGNPIVLQSDKAYDPFVEMTRYVAATRDDRRTTSPIRIAKDIPTISL